MVRAATLILMFVVGSTIGLTPSRRESGSTPQRIPAFLELARNGITGYSIVLPEVPTPGEQFAAEELAAYLAQMSGAVFPVTRRTCGARPAIYISRPVPDRSASLEGEAYAITVNGQDVYVNGARDRAVIYAVYNLLETLGCAWYAPRFDFYSGRSEHVPRVESLVLNGSHLQVRRPTLIHRKLDVCEGISHSDRNLQQLVEWMPKIGFNTLMVPMDFNGSGRATWDKWRDRLIPELQKRDLILEVGGHGYQNFLNARLDGGRLFTEHNDWFGQGPDGRRSPDPGRVFCTSNQNAVSFVADAIIDYLKDRREIQIFDLWPPDVGKWCECARCLAQGSSAERHALLNNFIHGQLRAACPGVRLECLAYADTLVPASTPLDPGILLDFCPINQNFEHQIFDERGQNNREYAAFLLDWRRRFSGDIGVYTYYRKYAWKSLPVVIPRYIQRDFRWYLTQGIKGISIFAEPGDWFTFELNHYALGRLSWNPDLDMDKLMQDYALFRFGPAAPVARSILTVLEQDLPRFGSLPFTDQKAHQEISESLRRLAVLKKTLEGSTQLEERFRANVERLQLMCSYALRDLKIQEQRAAGVSPDSIRPLVLDLYGFLHAHPQAGTFLVYFGVEQPRLLKKYGLVEQ